ncbi:MAG: MFS transporter [Chlamydiota bacterium]
MTLPASYSRAASLIGNLLEHYDSALFALLAPFIAPLFFYEKDPITALILTYGMLPLGLLTRPLGSLFFGWIGDRLGRRRALFYSLSGTAIVTVGMGVLPVYQTIGIWAPIFLALARMLQSFFVAGESVGGALFLLEHTKKTKRSLFSSFYDISTLGGIFIASIAVSSMSLTGNIEHNWRILFLAGGLTAVLGLFFRYTTKKEPEYAINIEEKISIISILKKHKKALLSITLASGFSYVTYAMAFTFLNAFIPLITSLTQTEVIRLNTKLLMIDVLLLPCFGYLAHKIGKGKIMLAGSLCCAIGAIPLFSLLPNSSIYTVTAVRLCIITFGVAFAASYYAWAMELVPKKHRYLILALGSALGSQLIGAPSIACCLWLYKITGLIQAPGLYLTISALGASLVLYRLQSKSMFLAPLP